MFQSSDHVDDPLWTQSNRFVSFMSWGGDLIEAFQYLKGSYNKDGEILFTKAHSDWTRGNGFKMRVHLG